LNGAGVLVVLEREMPGSLALSQISQQFHLTNREQEAVALLLQGFGNKKMAERMGISANTVKAFLRMVTIKMGVSSRSGIVTKVLGLVLSSGSSEPPGVAGLSPSEPSVGLHARSKAQLSGL
jgi:DNA-binding CsgD family transcriptional regulator